MKYVIVHKLGFAKGHKQIYPSPNFRRLSTRMRLFNSALAAGTALEKSRNPKDFEIRLVKFEIGDVLEI